MEHGYSKMCDFNCFRDDDTMATVAIDTDINRSSFQSLATCLYDDCSQLLEMGMISLENILKNLKT